MEIGHTEIDIEASKDAVWGVLTDFASYPAWNPFLRAVRGSLREGERLEVEIAVNGSAPTKIHPKIILVDDSPQFRWRARFGVPGLLECEHCLIVEEFRPTRVRFFQRQKWSGALVGRSADRIEAFRLGSEAMNAALRSRVDALRQTRSA